MKWYADSLLNILAVLTIISLTTSRVLPYGVPRTPLIERNGNSDKKKQTLWDKYKVYILSGGGTAVLASIGGMLYVWKRNRSSSRIEPSTIEEKIELSEDTALRKAALWSTLIEEQNNAHFLCAEQRYNTPRINTGEGTPFDREQQARREALVVANDTYAIGTEKSKIERLISEISADASKHYRFKKFIALLLTQRRPGSPSFYPSATQAIHHEFGDDGIELMKKLLEPFDFGHHTIGRALQTTVPAALLVLPDDDRLKVARHLAEREILLQHNLIVSREEVGKTVERALSRAGSAQDLQDIQHAQTPLLARYTSGAYKDKAMQHFAHAASIAQQLRQYILNEVPGINLNYLEKLFEKETSFLKKTAEIFDEYIIKNLVFAKILVEQQNDNELLSHTWEIIRLFKDYGHGPVLSHMSKLI